MFGRKNNQTYPGPLPGSNRAGVSSDEILERLAQDYMNDRKWRRFFKFLVLGLVASIEQAGQVVGEQAFIDNRKFRNATLIALQSGRLAGEQRLQAIDELAGVLQRVIPGHAE